MSLTLSAAARNAAADAVVDLLDAGTDAGTIEIRSGTKPSSPDDDATGTLLATFTMSDPAFGDAATGVATATGTPTATGAAAGTAAWFRALDSDDNPVIDGTVTATGDGGDLTLNTTTVSVGVDLKLTSCTLTIPAS